MAEARRRDERIAVAIVDARGEAIQLDRMDGAVAAAVILGETAAAAAATFGCPSAELTERLGGEAAVALVAAALPYRITTVAGAWPITEDGTVIGGLGIGGPAPEVCAEIAAAALA